MKGGWSACVPTTYEVGHVCRKFEKHCPRSLDGSGVIHVVELFLPLAL
jgi:hypothetical protein